MGLLPPYARGDRRILLPVLREKRDEQQGLITNSSLLQSLSSANPAVWIVSPAVYRNPLR